MILVDSSVWIHFFTGASNAAVQSLTHLLSDVSAPIATADLVVFEVLRGFRHNEKLREAEHLLSALPQVQIGGLDVALLSAHNYRALRGKGHTIASSIDVLLASYCIKHGHALLHADQDFDAFETQKGLIVWRGAMH
jgi:predicted nucleic acid-binding protein